MIVNKYGNIGSNSYTQGSRKSESNSTFGADLVIAQKKQTNDSINISNEMVEMKDTKTRAEVAYLKKVETFQYDLKKTEGKGQTYDKLAELNEIGKYEDYTGMNEAEIYRTIYDRYNNAFGNNLAAYTSLAQTDEQTDIFIQFREEVLQITGENNSYIFSHEVFREAMGYKNMSIEEVENAIIKKYNGGKSTMDFLNMTGELARAGTFPNSDIMTDYLHNIDRQIGDMAFAKSMTSEEYIKNYPKIDSKSVINNFIKAIKDADLRNADKPDYKERYDEYKVHMDHLLGKLIGN